jgi:hypothetical protein
MSVLVDMNVMLRRTKPDHQHYAVAVESVAQVLSTGEPVYFTLQNISEFWKVVPRPWQIMASDSLRHWPRSRKSNGS